jgi:hypothetical protein
MCNCGTSGTRLSTVTHVRLSVQHRLGDAAMWDIVQDLRYAFRQFRRAPGFVLTAVLSLTLGIGATTAIFSVVYGVLLDPYPYKDADRMVHVELRDKSGRGPLLFTVAPDTSRFARLRRSMMCFCSRVASKT